MKKEQHAKHNKKIADLKHRNSELVNVARRLEQKAKTLHMENSKRISESSHSAKDFEEQKRNFANIAAKMENEHKKEISVKDRELKTLKHQLDDLKKALREAKRVQISKDGSDTSAAALKQSQKESLQHQKLAAAGSKKVTIRSLSMPVTARQKILEESNRTLRRQLSQLEENYRQACNGVSNDDIKSELEKAKTKCEELEKETKEAKIQQLNLESQLQIAKVESSDTNIKLVELQKSFNQLQNEYGTVHEQLSVAIKERDAAITQCKENVTQISQMELRAKNMNERPVGGDENERIQYQVTLQKLQTKVLELEKQCHEQNETNRLLNEQLLKLMKRSPVVSPVESKENSNASSAKSSSPQEKIATPKERELDFVDASPSRGQINANHVNGNSDKYQEKQSRGLQGGHGQGVAVRNEDTEVEDFAEEEITETMDHTDAGKVRVYIAKYTYNPYEGPNDSPEAELPLLAGDYVYVYGPMDEDGFFEGELTNGRRGLVPSNFLEPVHDGNYNEFGIGMKSGLKMDSSASKCSSSELSHSESLISSCASIGSGRMSHKGDILGLDQSVLVHGALPYPRRLRIDKRLSHSLIIGWVSPQLSEGESIDEYHIFVNGEFKTAVNGKKLKAVIENIRHEQANRICICAVSQWGISDENLCVLTHGRGANTMPTGVRMEKVGASNARVAWTPSSSLQAHIVTVDEEGPEIGLSSHLKNPTHMAYTVSPPAYRLTFGNLKPNVRYKVTVNIKGSTDEARSFTRFTTPESGPPDPPLGVQIEECQNANSLLITWFPVTLNTLGTSNGVVVKGYSIHVADTKICEVNSPTMDQCTIRAQTLADAFKGQLSMGPKKNLYRLSKPSKPILRWNKHVPPSVSIKTLAVNGQESDCSDPCIIPQELYTKLVDLVKDDLLSSPRSGEARNQKRTPLLRSVESSDADVSFSSDISIPGLNSPRPTTRRKAEQNGTDSSDSGKSQLSKSKILEQSRIVPSIEITHDTSSDEDPVVNGRESRTSSNKSVKSRRMQHSAASISPKLDKIRKHPYKSSDNDDAASVSSGHTSSSNGIDILKRSKVGSVAERAARVILQHQLERGESSDFSNPEDSALINSNRGKRNLNLSETNEKHSALSERSPDQPRRHQHKNHHIKSNVRRPHSVMSDHSQGSQRSSSRHVGHHQAHRVGRHSGRRDIFRQSTMSSQSGSEFASEIESTYPIDVDKNSVSLFVALFSYDPQMMSPNADSYEEELSFIEGQLIKVYGDKDEDGFYYGETNSGMRGFVPCNMVSQVEVDSMQMLLDLHERGYLPSASPDEDEQSTSEDKTRSGASQVFNGPLEPGGVRRRHFKALFDYDPRQLSPNADADIEISFSQGDIITVQGDMDDDGFFKGRLGTKEGLVPSNFIQEISEQELQENLHKKIVPTEMEQPRQPSAVPSPIPKPRANRNNGTDVQMNNAGPAFSTPSSTINPNRVDNAVSRKKGGFMSKGKKLFKKLGGSQDGKKR